jgi:two-component system, NtrC family, sensor kinase
METRTTMASPDQNTPTPADPQPEGRLHRHVRDRLLVTGGCVALATTLCTLAIMDAELPPFNRVAMLIGIGMLQVVVLIATALRLLRARVLRPLVTVTEVLGGPVPGDDASGRIALLAEDEIGDLGRNLRLALGELALLRRASDAASNGIAITDPTKPGNPLVYVNAAYEEMVGGTAAELIGRGLHLSSHDPDGADPMAADIETALREGRPCTAIYHIRRREGSDAWLRIEVSPVRDSHGSLIALIAILLDVSERRRYEEELKTTKAFLDAIITELPVTVFCKDSTDHRFRLWNRAAEEMFGLKTADVIGRNDYDFFPKEQADFFWAKDAETITSGQMVDIPEEAMTRADGSIRYLHTRKVVVAGPDGQPGWLLGLSEDITERRAAAELLREAYAESEELLSILSAILIGVDAQDRIVRFNAAAERILGRNAADVLGRSLAESGIRLDWGEILPLTIATTADGISRGIHDLRLARHETEEVFLDLSIIRTRATGDGGRPVIALVGFDVTQRRQMEAQRAQGQKLEAIGHLAAGIAHEINTPIQFIGDNLHFLSTSFADLTHALDAVKAHIEAGGDSQGDLAQAMAQSDLPFLVDEVPRAVAQSLEGVTRVAGIVQALKKFSHPDGGAKQPIDINACILTTLTVARNEYKYAAELITQLATDLPPIPGIAGELGQTFLNLVVNAAQSITEKNRDTATRGTITISTALVRDMLEVRISDTGTGIRPEHHQRLFTPFFTTKPVGKGTGQGLALCHAVVVQHHGGTITCDSEFGSGCTFIIRLPLTASHDGNAQ